MPDPLKSHIAFTSNAPAMARWGAQETVSVTALARRHGWDVSEHYDEIGNTIHFRLDRDRPGHVSGFLWHNRKLAQAFVHNADGASIRTNQEQLERFIVGVDCNCLRDPDFYFPINGSEPSTPDCPTHGEAK